MSGEHLVKRIIIVGGGFAGVKCARTLRKRLSIDAYEIVLFDRENHMVFHPLLAEVAGGSIKPDAVAGPLRQMLPTISYWAEEVTSLDLSNSQAEYENYDDRLRRLPYDHVVIACGAAVNLATIPGMADHAFPLKTAGDAQALRRHVMQQLEKAEVCEEPARRRWFLSFVVVGGGFSGVEVAGEINDLVRGGQHLFPNITDEDVTVTIIHSRDQLLPEISSRLREFTRTKMESAGIHVRLQTRVALATPEGVGLPNGEMIRGATVVCTIGTTMCPVVERLDVKKERGRLVTDHDMRLVGFDNAWAVGDCAHIVNAYDGSASATTGQFAERQGGQVAENVVRTLRGQLTRPFRFKPLGQLCAIGGRRAVAELFGLHISGFVAWFFWRGVYLMKLPGWSRRLKVAFDWGWELLFFRDLSYLKPDQTKRVSNTYYKAGDYVFRQGDPASTFYVIQQGEVEFVREPSDSNPEEIVAILGKGDFFGERALIDQIPRTLSVRARTPVEVIVLGKTVFSQISDSLAPLNDAFAAAVKRRTNVWQQMPVAREILAHEPLSAFIEPLRASPLARDAPLEQLVTLFDQQPLDFCSVIDPTEHLIGVVTRTDLVRAIEVLAAIPDIQARRALHIENIMISDPIALTADDSTLLAVATMREHGLKQLPIIRNQQDRRLVGYVRIETVMNRVWQKAPKQVIAEA